MFFDKAGGPDVQRLFQHPTMIMSDHAAQLGLLVMSITDERCLLSVPDAIADKALSQGGYDCLVTCLHADGRSAGTLPSTQPCMNQHSIRTIG